MKRLLYSYTPMLTATSLCLVGIIEGSFQASALYFLSSVLCNNLLELKKLLRGLTGCLQRAGTWQSIRHLCSRQKALQHQVPSEGQHETRSQLTRRRGQRPWQAAL